MSRQRDGADANPWIRTADGARFHYLNFDGNEYDVDVAAAALSRITRYAGHIKDEFDDDIYSVAQHSVYVFRLLLKKKAPAYTFPWAITHDMPEAYFIDMPSPLKMLIPDYGAMEDRSAAAMRKTFGIPYDDNVEAYVKWADNQLYFAERLVLTEIPEGEMDLSPAPEFTLEEIDPDFYLWRPRKARAEYQRAFVEAMTIYRGEKYANAS